MRMFETIITSFFCSLDMQFNEHAVVLLHGQERWRMPFTYFFLRQNAFPSRSILMLLLSFNTNYDGLTVLKQSPNRTIILSAEFPHFLEPSPSFLMTILLCYSSRPMIGLVLM